MNRLFKPTWVKFDLVLAKLAFYTQNMYYSEWKSLTHNISSSFNTFIWQTVTLSAGKILMYMFMNGFKTYRGLPKVIKFAKHVL